MKVLFINHYFDQDIKELVNFKRDEHEFHWISPQYFANPVYHYLPPEVFDGLSAYFKKEYEEKRIKVEKIITKLLYKLYETYDFDIVISPSDTFFYVRPLINACHKIGVPFFVAQKETTISPGTMEVHSKDVGKFCPFISDYMTVCSENHKEFWLRAGTAKDLIKVTGQPRFDLYYRVTKNDLHGLKDMSPKIQNKKVILFFTYELNAYLESANDYGDWKGLREQTEDILSKAAKTGEYLILIKPHPQHNLEDISYFSARVLAQAGNKGVDFVKILDRGMDARELIIQADIIVAFQTTVLLEALAIGKRVIYTYWGDSLKRSKSFVLPFHDFPEILDIAYSPDELMELLIKENKGIKINEKVIDERMKLVNKYLGPFDGMASMRTWASIDEIFSKYSTLTIEQKLHRKKILKLKKYHVFKGILACSINIFIDNLLIILFTVVGLEKYVKKIEMYKYLRKRRKKELQEVRKKEIISSFQIIGPIKVFFNKKVW